MPACVDVILEMLKVGEPETTAVVVRVWLVVQEVMVDGVALGVPVALWEVVKWLGRLLLALADIVVPRRRQYGVRVGGVCGRRHYGNRLQREENVNLGLITGSEELWQLSVLVFVCDQVVKSADGDFKKLYDDIQHRSRLS